MRAGQNPSSRVDIISATGFVLSGDQSGIEGAASTFCPLAVDESVEDASITGLLGFWPQKSQLDRRESWSMELQIGRRL